MTETCDDEESRTVHGYDVHSEDDTPALPEPIKVRWQMGDSRSKYETRSLEPASADGDIKADYARRANARLRTRITIVTEGELRGTVKYLDRHVMFSAPNQAVWGSLNKQKAARRRLNDIREQAEALGVDELLEE